MPEITLSQGTIEYRDEGAGRPVVLIHGELVLSFSQRPERALSPKEA
jgi:hypothetical protein